MSAAATVAVEHPPRHQRPSSTLGTPPMIALRSNKTPNCPRLLLQYIDGVSGRNNSLSLSRSQLPTAAAAGGGGDQMARLFSCYRGVALGTGYPAQSARYSRGTELVRGGSVYFCRRKDPSPPSSVCRDAAARLFWPSNSTGLRKSHPLILPPRSIRVVCGSKRELVVAGNRGKS